MHVTCATCRREELWTPSDGGWQVEVLLEGGSRRPSVDPQWERGRTALRSARGEQGPVVGVCDACGQLLVADDPEAAPMRVEVNTPAGRLVVEGQQVEGPEGSLSEAAAEGFLERQYAPGRFEGLAQQLGLSVFFVALLPVLFLWLFAILFVWTFLSSLSAGTSPLIDDGPLQQGRP